MPSIVVKKNLKNLDKKKISPGDNTFWTSTFLTGQCNCVTAEVFVVNDCGDDVLR